MNIDLYNDTFFSAKGRWMFTSNPYKPFTSIDELEFKPHLPSPITTTKELFQESGNNIPSIETCNTGKLMPYTIPSFNTLHNKLFLLNTYRRTTSNEPFIQSKSIFHIYKKLTQTPRRTMTYGASSSPSILHIQIIVTNSVAGGLTSTHTINSMTHVPLYLETES